MEFEKARRGRHMRRALAAVTVVAAVLAALPGAALARPQTNQRFRVVSAGPRVPSAR